MLNALEEHLLSLSNQDRQEVDWELRCLLFFSSHSKQLLTTLVAACSASPISVPTGKLTPITPFKPSSPRPVPVAERRAPAPVWEEVEEEPTQAPIYKKYYPYVPLYRRPETQEYYIKYTVYRRMKPSQYYNYRSNPIKYLKNSKTSGRWVNPDDFQEFQYDQERLYYKLNSSTSRISTYKQSTRKPIVDKFVIENSTE